MLPLLIGLLVAAGPLMRGAWDLWAQSLLFIAVAAGSALWLAARIGVGFVPLPSRRNILWTGGLAALAGLSAWSGPLPAYSLDAWRALLLGLWIFPAMAAVSKDERAAIDEAVRAASWALMLLAFYQHFRQGIDRPPSALLNQNVFAGTLLMLLPLAAQKRDWLLFGGLLACLWWAHSVGAWLGLAGALILTRRHAGAALARAGLLVGFVCLVILYAKLQSPDVLHRWQWWEGAARMAWERPWLGFGPGTYAHVLPATQEQGRELWSLYAHEHFLETAAELGWPYLIVWCAGLAHCLRRGGEHKRFGALAVLIQSLWDYSLSLPGNFWLFCYFAASAISESSRGMGVPARRKIPAALLALAAGAAACGLVARRWQADRLKSAAVESFARGAPTAETLSLLDKSASLADDPETERLAAQAHLAGLAPGPGGSLPAEPLRAAAERLERAARLNPYRASTWSALERLYLQLGLPDQARGRRLEGAAYCPPLRLRPAQKI